MAETLGQAIRRYRTEAGYPLRRFAELLGISAAHQSDIEYDRRRPSEKVLQKTARLLRGVGASFESLRALDTRLEPELQELVKSNPEVGQLLRQVRESGRSPREVLRELQRYLENQSEEEK
jgi:transcriptional regulator with XRE-family HTH domain